jgi:ribose 5-phosphate isomerase A
VAPSPEYRKVRGREPHHNVDKGLLVAGQSSPRPGGRKTDGPMRLVFGDQATAAVDVRVIPVNEIVETSAKQWLRGAPRFVASNRHVVCQNEIRLGSPPLVSQLPPFTTPRGGLIDFRLVNDLRCKRECLIFSASRWSAEGHWPSEPQKTELCDTSSQRRHSIVQCAGALIRARRCGQKGQTSMDSQSPELHAIAQRALHYIADGSIVGLGTGRAATAFLHALGERVRRGLRVRGVPTSRASAELADELGIPLTTLAEVERIDVDVDGADEVDPHLNLIKGYGGALVREKIVAAASRRLVILVGPEKLVPQLGTRGKLPVEVVPFGIPLCRRKLADLGYPGDVRQQVGKPFLTDNGNHILDCRVGPLEKPADLERAILAVPGVVGTGLFLGMADTVLVQRVDSVEVFGRTE